MPEWFQTGSTREMVRPKGRFQNVFRTVALISNRPTTRFCVPLALGDRDHNLLQALQGDVAKRANLTRRIQCGHSEIAYWNDCRGQVLE